MVQLSLFLPDGKPNTGLTFAERLARVARVAMMRADGFAWKQIGQHFGVSATRARQLYEQARRLQFNRC